MAFHDLLSWMTWLGSLYQYFHVMPHHGIVSNIVHIASSKTIPDKGRPMVCCKMFAPCCLSKTRDDVESTWDRGKSSACRFVHTVLLKANIQQTTSILHCFHRFRSNVNHRPNISAHHAITISIRFHKGTWLSADTFAWCPLNRDFEYQPLFVFKGSIFRHQENHLTLLSLIITMVTQNHGVVLHEAKALECHLDRGAAYALHLFRHILDQPSSLTFVPIGLPGYCWVALWACYGRIGWARISISTARIWKNVHDRFAGSIQSIDWQLRATSNWSDGLHVVTVYYQRTPEEARHTLWG